MDDDASVSDWRTVHNDVVPTAVLSLDEVRERTRRQLLDGTAADPGVRDGDRDRSRTHAVPSSGLRGAPYAHGLERARMLGADAIETIVLASNTDGLRFAHTHGFVEVERYLLPGDTIEWVTLRLGIG